MYTTTYTLLILLGVTFINGLPFADSNENSYENAILNRGAPDCLVWYLTQGDPQELLAQTLKPPCHIPISFPKTLLGGWSVDPECDASKQPKTCDYHKGAYGCYRHAFSSSGPGAQACYDRSGQWIGDVWKGAGTVDAATPLGDFSQQTAHFLVDVAPYYSCCKITLFPKSICNLYYEKRPPGQCENKPAV
ncbi:hypothetical protein I4U23_012312 [Adineta vaga]|nr:hypothetical protein I4U23_012312 [Adineta vaga]